MGTLFSTLDIARSGLQVAQVQMDVAGHNVANVNKEGYSRQRVDLVSPTPVTQSYGAIGRGVQVKLIERLRETFLDTVYRNEAGNLGASNIRAPYFDRIQDLFNEPGDQGFGTNITAFFDSLNDFANNVEEVAVRMSVVNQAETLASSFNQLARQIYALRTNANEEVVNTVPDINSLARQIASLNVTIRNSEAAGVKANDLRDERDLLLDRLAGTINIQFRERDNGQIDVLIGGESFIDGDQFRMLEAVRDSGIDPLRQDLVTVRFADNGQAVNVQGGLLYGALQVRDTDLAVLTNRVDTLAATLIREINTIHAAGNGLDNLSGVVSATNAVTDASAALNAAGLPFAVEPGSFDVIVYDSSGNSAVSTVFVTAATTLDSLAADLNTLGHFSASVTNGVLSLGAASSYTFSFANDTSGVLAALGINGLFTGHDAASMGVNKAIEDNPRLLTSAFSSNVLDTGDNTAALALANVRNLKILENGAATINDYYETTIVRVGTDAHANAQQNSVQKSFVDDFLRRRQEVSGVSIDEEVTNMMLFQRGYEASARVISVIDRMLDALFNAAA